MALGPVPDADDLSAHQLPLPTIHVSPNQALHDRLIFTSKKVGSYKCKDFGSVAVAQACPF